MMQQITTKLCCKRYNFDSICVWFIANHVKSLFQLIVSSSPDQLSNAVTVEVTAEAMQQIPRVIQKLAVALHQPSSFPVCLNWIKTEKWQHVWQLIVRVEDTIANLWIFHVMLMWSVKSARNLAESHKSLCAVHVATPFANHVYS